MGRIVSRLSSRQRRGDRRRVPGQRLAVAGSREPTFSLAHLGIVALSFIIFYLDRCLPRAQLAILGTSGGMHRGMIGFDDQAPTPWRGVLRGSAGRVFGIWNAGAGLRRRRI